MDLRYLESFVAVVQYGSLAEAARRQDLTPAAIAAQLHALEEDLGATLVRRAGRSVKPTEAGIKILERARAVIRDVRDLRVVAGDGTTLGELRLGVFMSAMSSVLPPVLQGFYGQFPEANVYVELSHSVDLCQLVSSGQLDAAIVVEPQFAVGKNCDWQALIEEPLVLVVPAQQAGSDPLALLRTEPFIRYDRAVFGGQMVDRYLRDHGIRPRQRLEIDGLMGIAAMVAQGLGIALLPDWTPIWNSGLALARIPLPDRPPVRRVGLIWAKTGPRVSLAEAFLAQANQVFGKLDDQRNLI